MLLTLTLSLLASALALEDGVGDVRRITTVHPRGVGIHKRSTDAQIYPDTLFAKIEGPEGTESLHLSKARSVANTKVQFASGQERHINLRDIAFYHDRENGAGFAVNLKDGDYQYEGGYEAGGKLYEVRPARGHSANRVTRDVSGLHTITQLHAENDFADIFENMDDIEEVKENARRQTADEPQVIDGITQYHVEVVYMIDYKSVEYWIKKMDYDETLGVEAATKFYMSTFNVAASLYADIDNTYDIRINLWLKELIICDSENACPLLRDSLRPNTDPTKTKEIYVASEFKPAFKLWRYEQLNEEGNPASGHKYDWYNPDVFLVATRRQILSDYGLSYLGGFGIGKSVCRGGFGMQVITDWSHWRITAHEIGHILGASHDSVNSVAECGCPSNFIMRSCSGDDAIGQKDPDSISPCSVNSFKNLFAGQVDGVVRKCLFEKPSDAVADDWIPDMQGEMFTQDEMCSEKYGSDFIGANGADGGRCNSKNECKVLVCGRKASFRNAKCKYPWTRRTGTSCGENMHCMHGLCVDKTDAPTYIEAADPVSFSVPDNCVDDASFTFTTAEGDKDCAALVDYDMSLCLTESSVENNCVASCMARGLADGYNDCD